MGVPRSSTAPPRDIRRSGQAWPKCLRNAGWTVTPEQVLITTGSQQALDLVARALLDPGDRVVIESPSYLAGIQLFDSAEVDYQTVPMDAEGMVVDGLAAALNGAKLLYTLPNFQNPTGLTLSANRRVELARRVVEAGVAIVEDDAYHDLRYDGERLPTVSSLAENPWAIYTGSFSKVIAPGLRVGYLCGVSGSDRTPGLPQADHGPAHRLADATDRLRVLRPRIPRARHSTSPRRLSCSP